MPELSTDLHVGMLKRGLAEHPDHEVYGLHWGDPKRRSNLRFFTDHFVTPYLNPNVDAIEIGPGGGRWTQLLMGFRTLYAVDYHQELLDQVGKNMRSPRLKLVHNDGLTLPGIADRSIEFVFSFDVFVHLDERIRNSYLAEIHRVLTDTGVAVLHYGDKRKHAAASNHSFAQNTGPAMRQSVLDHGFLIQQENLTLFEHSNVIVFRRNAPKISQFPPGLYDVLR